jgi:hypothetical protein
MKTLGVLMKAQPGLLKVILPLALFILSFGLYSYTVAPTITWKHDGYDAGDLITAAYTLGIPHPTGYPTYMLLGKAFTLLPFGDVAYRMNLLSTFCAALTVVLAYLVSRTLLGSRPYATVASVCAALLLATSRIFWSQALITEVYALNCLFFAITLYLLLQLETRLEEQPADPSGGTRTFRILMLTTWIYGLSLGNHLTMAFSAPLVLFHCMVILRHRILSLSQWARVFLAFLLGVSIYIYLPVRAGSQPLMNWGNPNTLRGFLWMLSGGIYRQYVLALPLAYWAERLMAWIGLLRQQFGILGAALGLLGAWEHAKRIPQQFAILMLTFAIYSVYAIGYNTTDSYVYLLPVYFLYALWVAQGAQYALGTVTSVQSRWSNPVTVLLCVALLALPLGSLVANLPKVDLSNDYTAYDYGSQVFSQVPDGSIILSATDAHTFTLWYFARVVTGRDKVALIDRDLLGYDWYVAGLRHSYPWLDLPPTSGGTLSTDRLLEANMQRYAVFLTDINTEWTARYRFQQQGALYRLQAKPDSAP